MNENVSLGRIAGIHVGFNWSLLVIAALIAWSLAVGLLPTAAPGQTSGAYWTAGIISAFVYLASLLAHELAHSFVAPLTSLVLGVVFFLLSVALGGGAHPSLLAATLSWLGYINILLGVFNLLPAFPLDGGRILQSLIWQRTGDRLRATSIAARIGMAFAFLFIAYGLVTFFVSGSVIGGVWFIFLGWFLLSAARAEEAGGL